MPEEEVTVESKFSLAAQMGDVSASQALLPECMLLRKLFKSTMSGCYSRDVVEFAPVLRVDGALWHWDREGVGNLRVSKKTATATIDVFVPVSAWQGVPGSALRRYLAQHLRVAFRSMGERIQSKGLDCDLARLERDVARVLDEFLAQR